MVEYLKSKSTQPDCKPAPRITLYRVIVVVVDLGWVLWLGCPGRMVEHPISSQPNPGPWPPRSPCRRWISRYPERVSNIPKYCRRHVSTIVPGCSHGVEAHSVSDEEDDVARPPEELALLQPEQGARPRHRRLHRPAAPGQPKVSIWRMKDVPFFGRISCHNFKSFGVVDCLLKTF